MADAKETAEYIKLDLPVGLQQTEPVPAEKRLPADDITISLCDSNDASDIAAGLYEAFPAAFWDHKEPIALRPPEQATRQTRLANRLRAVFLNPKINWVKATLTTTGQIIGVAGWVAPGNPIHNHFRKSAVDFYGWREKLGWSDEEFEEMWKGVDLEAWDGTFSKDDETRKEVLGEEEHWYLAPLYTLPGFQGRGVGTRLLDWAFKQADATSPVTPCYLESAPTARAVYMHAGFVPVGNINFVRRGPRKVTEEEMQKVHAKVVDSEVRGVGKVV
ncbi:hypothetical protein P154DRAFT_192352 [Amniculicola lignicola CBS 123094]|uniref:N-acetyltransferase domain-containing protein n=1 Tax=Amniculicola lignicola CBS 123094 TaxID=1392246 RepID=A0A6A5WG98_9PLEO|nr:hypothetical protein P154DRAFT_192352 [Amniculicola lignicola CBS 123094]